MNCSLQELADNCTRINYMNVIYLYCIDRKITELTAGKVHKRKQSFRRKYSVAVFD